MDTKNEMYLWEFSWNLLVKPQRVKLAKECPKTYWLDRVCCMKVTKVKNPKPHECVGYTDYCRYYLTKEDAEAGYEQLKREREEDFRRSRPEYIEEQAVRNFVKKLKEEFFFMRISSTKDTIYQFTDSQLERFMEGLYVKEE